MRNGNREEEHSGLSASVEMPDDIFMDIISRCPLRFVVQCKILSKNFKGRISHPEFSKILFQCQKVTSTQLIYLVHDGRLIKQFPKISFNPITQSVMTLCFGIEILGSCNGLIFFEFERIRCYCVFNPLTGEHQLIPYPNSPRNELKKTGLVVDYPNSDQYKLVTISNIVENSNLFYKFHLLSSEQSGLWHEIQLRTNSFISLPYGSPPVYWHDSLYFLRSDGSVLALDTKKEEAVLIDRPEFIDHFVLSYGKILTSRDMSGSDIWLGRAKDLLTLVCIFRKYIVIGTYDRTSSCWRVSHTLDNFVLGPDGNIIGFPVWIDSKQVSFLVRRPPTQYHDLYEYDTNINVYTNVAVLDTVDYPMNCFHPTLACVHKTPSNYVTTAQQAYIAEKLDNIRRFIIEGTNTSEEEAAAAGEGRG
ncbi:putative F-box protein At1g33530 [Solanum verrucosum]|uniref:putative F-box protein At1g33530 n=1 Tax=Solanum verrucosum TaxID=315347 RepID=UPI0020D11312|nr:putative F-box protein At1g33530 [Solanum verrucosum]